jgi:integrase
MEGTDELSDLTRVEAFGYVQYLTDRYAPDGVASRVRSLRAFYGWLVKEELIDKNPMKGISVSVPREAKLTADEEAVSEMFASARGNRRDLAMLTLLVDSGCRKGEIAALKAEHVDLASGMVRFPVSKSMPRTVPLSERSIAALGHWMRQRGDAPGSLWAVDNPYGLVRNIVSRHSKGTLTPHALRRAFAVRALRRGVTPGSLMRLCGWTSHQVLQTYTLAAADDIAAAEFLTKMR